MDDFKADFGLVNDSTDDYGGFAGSEENGHESVDVSIIVFRILVCAVGTIGNLLVIFVILVLREYEKAITYWYVLQLAIADTLFLLTLPFKVVQDIHDEWIFSDAACRVKEGILFLNYYSSILFLTIMSVDRYVAVCHGFYTGFQKLRTKRTAFTVTVITWTVSLMLCIPVFIYSGKTGIHPHCKCMYQFPNAAESAEERCDASTAGEAEYLACLEVEKRFENQDRCAVIDYAEYVDIFGSGGDYGSYETYTDGYDSTTTSLPSDDVYRHGCTYSQSGPGWKAFLSFNFAVMFIVPFLIMSVCYAKIILRLNNSAMKSDAEQQAQPSTSTKEPVNTAATRPMLSSARAEKNRNRVTILCGTLVVVFLLCWLPYHSVHMAKMTGIQGSTEFCLTLSSVTSIFAFLNSALNPYIYNFIGTRFSKRLRSAVGTIRKSVKKGTTSLSSGGATVIYRARKGKESGSTSTGNTATVVTKINPSKHGGGHRLEPSSGETESQQPGQTSEHRALMNPDTTQA